MADTVRESLASADDVIGRVRARLVETPAPIDGETANAMRIADEWARYAEGLADESKLVDAARNFRQQWPALVRWREKVLGNQRRAKPSIVAAAFESLALECFLAGQHELAARAQQAAIDAVRSRRKVVPIRSGANAAQDAQAQSA